MFPWHIIALLFHQLGTLGLFFAIGLDWLSRTGATLGDRHAALGTDLRRQRGLFTHDGHFPGSDSVGMVSCMD